MHNITSDEAYNRRTLEGDQSIYLPQPNNNEPTYKGIEDKMNRGEIERKIAQGLAYINPKTGKAWYDEDPNAVF